MKPRLTVVKKPPADPRKELVAETAKLAKLFTQGVALSWRMLRRRRRG